MPKKYQVIKATQKPIDGLDVAGQHMKFGKSGGFVVSDPAVAGAIEQQYGEKSGGLADVIVLEDDRPARGERRTWQVGVMPWKKDKND